jgi:hypothetical protein
MLGSVAILIASLAIKPHRQTIRHADRRGLSPSPHANTEGELVLPAAAHEGADLGRRFIAGAFGLLVLSLAVVTLGVLWLFPLPSTDRTLNPPLPTYPSPRLQPSPRQEMQRFLAGEYEQLTTYGWVDKAHQIVRIPIDVAMKRVAQNGIPGWPTDAAQAANGSNIATDAAQ